MAEQWYFQLEGEQVGPIDAAQLQALARRGRVTPETLVRTASSKGWVPAMKVGGLEFSAAKAPSADVSPKPEAVASAPAPATVSPAASATTATSTQNPSSATMRAPASLKKAKLLTAGISPAQSQRLSDSNALAAEPVPPPIPSNIPYGYGPDQVVPPPAVNFNQPQIPMGIPMGVAIGGVPPSVASSPPTDSPQPWINVNVGSTTIPVASRPVGDERRSTDKKANSRRKLYWMIGGVTGVVLALSVVGVILIVRGDSAVSEQEKQVAKKGLEQELTEASSASNSNGDELNTTSGDKQALTSTASGAKAERADANRGGNATSAKADSAARRGTDKKGTANADVASAIQSVGRWFDMSSSSSVSSKTMKLQLTGAWLDGEAGDGKSDEDTEVQPKGSSSAARRVYFELRITNTQADTPLNYSPWNGDGAGGGKSLALLATNDGTSCSFVPLSQTKEPSRQKAPVRLKPGQSIAELLVFETPSADYETLQLLLPTSAVGQAGRYLGLKIPRDFLATQKPVELAQEDVPNRTVNARATPTVGSPPKIIANSEPAAAVEPPAPAAKPREESIDDLRKSIVDSVKDKQKEKDDEVAKEREANKKKP